MSEELRELTAQLTSLQEDVSTLISRTEALDREIRNEIIPRTADMWSVVMDEPDPQGSVIRRSTKDKGLDASVVRRRSRKDNNRLSAQFEIRRLSAQYDSDQSGASSSRLSKRWSSLRSLSSMGKRSISVSSLSILMMNEVK